MAFNGSGVFSRLYSWVNDAASSIPITATRMDSDSNDIAAGLSNCVTRDGQSPPSANIPMGGFKLTGLAAATANGDAARYEQVGALALAQGAATSGANSNITSLSGLTTPLSVAQGGTGSATQNYVDLTTPQIIAGVKTFSSMPVVPAQSMVRVNTSNGYGSTNTFIRRFTTVVATQGSDITYADSATLGASFTINANGVYAFSYSNQIGAAASFGLSLNTSQPTTAFQLINASDRLVLSDVYTANGAETSSVTVYLTAGSVVRPHDGLSTANSTPAVVQMTAVRVS